jgi:hypothetical protein
MAKPPALKETLQRYDKRATRRTSRPAVVADGAHLLTRDPATGVTVEALGRDRGPDEAGTAAAAREAAERAVWDGRRHVRARGMVTTLDKLEASGLITKDEHMAGVMFADAFAVAGQDPLRSSLGALDSVRGGESRAAHITERQRHARREVEDVVDMLGGYGHRVARAVLDVCGLSLSLREHVAKQRQHEGNKAYTLDMARGIIPAALLAMARRQRLNNERQVCLLPLSGQ